MESCPTWRLRFCQSCRLKDLHERASLKLWNFITFERIMGFAQTFTIYLPHFSSFTNGTKIPWPGFPLKYSSWTNTIFATPPPKKPNKLLTVSCIIILKFTCSEAGRKALAGECLWRRLSWGSGGLVDICKMGVTILYYEGIHIQNTVQKKLYDWDAVETLL